jgi:hypothetical protein
MSNATRVDLDNIERHIGEPPVDGIRMHPVTDAEMHALVAELRAAREAHAALVEFHDSYDAGSDDRFKVRGRIFRILAEWDKAVTS